MPLASVTSQLTHVIAHQGAYAVFFLMALDALLPVGGELIMLYAGVLASGAIGQSAALFGAPLHDVDDQRVELFGSGALEGLVAARPDRLEALLAQTAEEELEKLGIVFDYEDLACVHRLTFKRPHEGQLSARGVLTPVGARRHAARSRS